MNIKIENLEQKAIEPIRFDLTERLDSFNKIFKTSLQPENSIFGITETLKDTGILERLSRKADGTAVKEYYREGKIFQSRESLKGKVITTLYDDNGTAYLRETVTKDSAGMLRNGVAQLRANIEIKKGNFTARTDSLGRPVSNKITDIKLSSERQNLSNKLKTSGYRAGDQRGHIIADILGGPASKENVVPQTSEANMSKMKQVENIVKEHVQNGDKVEYEVKTNYIGNDPDARPTSFEPKIKVNGQELELSPELKKIYNNDFSETGKAGKFVNNAKELITENAVKAIPHHKAGMEMGIEAAKITMAVSTVQNTVDFVQGEITAEELVTNIAKDTGTAAAVGYGTGFISSVVSTTMQQSSHQLIQSVGRSSIPAAVVSFGVQSYDSVVDFAKGDITGQELAYDLGENASSVAGGVIGGAMAGAALGSIVPGAGTAVGFGVGLVGSMVGCAVASEAYATAVEAGNKGAQVLLDKASDFAADAYEIAKIEVPESAESIRSALNDFASKNSLPFSI